MEVGLTRRRVIQGLRVNLVIGALGVCFGLVALFLDENKSDNPGPIETLATFAFLLFMPGAVWLLLCSILCSITLRVADGVIEQRLWKRFQLARRSISELTSVSGGGFSAIVLQFRDGRRLALPGIYAEDRYHFMQYLDELRPDLKILDGD
jgi:hypothetical protein